MRILVFGDSIAQGFWDTEGGWVARIRKTYDQQKVSGEAADPPVVFNLGISGDRTADILKRLKPEIEARLFEGEAYTLVIATGTNDTVYRGNEHESEPDIFTSQLTEIVQIARQYTSRILFVGLTPVVDKLVQPLRWSSSGKCYATERMALFDTALKEFCAKQHMPVVDLFTPFSKVKDLEKLLPDGAHPNNEGHQLMAEHIQPVLDATLQK